MPLSIQSIFQRGGRELIDVLTHSVFSFNTDVLFLYVVREYQFRPQAVAAIAIFDVFCATTAPARISLSAAIPPRELQLQHAIEGLRCAVIASTTDQVAAQTVGDCVDGDSENDADESPAPVAPAIPLPPRYLFDAIAANLNRAKSTKMLTLENRYDLGQTPLENLTDGRLNAAQRAFVDNVWTPRIRPSLVSSGFWQLATVG